jgi:hypothetical protein
MIRKKDLAAASFGEPAKAHDMSTEEKKRWIEHTQCAAHDGVDLLRKAKRERTAEYDECIRELSNFIETLRVTKIDGQQFELFEPANLINPELKKLLADPLCRIS